MRSPGSSATSTPRQRGEHVDTQPPLIDHAPSSRSSEHYRLNKRVALHARAGVLGRRKYTERKVWAGAPTEHQQRELDDLRKFEALKSCDELPDLRRSISASTLLGLKNAGKAHAYRLSLAQLRVLGLDGDDCYYARAYLAWVLCSQLGHGNEWLIPRHSDMAAIIECCETYAARASRELVARGLVRRTPLYGTVQVSTTDGARTYRRHVRGPSAFRVPSSVLERIGIRELSTGIAGEKYQASEIQPPRVNPDLRGDRERDRIDAPSLRPTSSAPTTHGVQHSTTDRAPTTTGPLAIAREAITTTTSPEADESSCQPSHSESALEPVAPLGASTGALVENEPPASATRRAAALERRLGEFMDRCQASYERRLGERCEEFDVATRTVRLALDVERERLKAAAARYAADVPRPVASADERSAYQRELEARRKVGRAMPDEAGFLVERRLGLCVLSDDELEDGGES